MTSRQEIIDQHKSILNSIQSLAKIGQLNSENLADSMQKLNKNRAQYNQVDGGDIESWIFIENAKISGLTIDSRHTIPLIFTDCHFGSLDVHSDIRLSFTKGSIGVLTLHPNCSADFSGISSIRRLKSNQCRDVTFRGVQEIGSLEIEFISGIKFYSCKFMSVVAKRGSVEVERTEFAACEFNLFENYQLMDILGSTAFENCTFKQTGPAYEEVYRHFKKCSVSHHNEFSVNLFAGLELKCKHYRSSTAYSWPDKVIGYFYEEINDFGLQPYRPLKLLGEFAVLVFLVDFHFSNITWQAAFWDTVVFLLWPFKVLFAKELLNFSSGSVFEYRYTYLFFGFVSSILWFFQILGIRRRYKVAS